MASGTAAALACANLAWIPPALLGASELRSFAAGETLFRHGERPVAMFHVPAGEIRLVRRAPDGTEMILQRSRGGFIVEASMAAQAYHCDAVAASPGHLVRFPIGVLRKALDQDRDFRDRWIARLAREVHRLRSQCERLGPRGAAQRVLH